MRKFAKYLVCVVFANTSDGAVDVRRRNLRKDKEIFTPDIKPELRIIGGTPIEHNRYPFAQVSLQSSGGVHQCGGSLVAPDIVMTAGHCFGFFSQVTVNVHDFSKKDSVGDVSETFLPVHYTFHPLFVEEKFRYDVLLVQLNTKVQNVEPVILNSIEGIPLINDELSVIGWGLTDILDPLAYPDISQRASVFYMSNDECASAGEGHYRGDVHDEMMCAQQIGKDACAGDSGGPLVQTLGEIDLQVGIVSWGRGCAGTYPGVYARISFLFDWIKINICATSERPPNYLNCPLANATAQAIAQEAVISASQTSQPLTLSPTRIPTGMPVARPTTALPTTRQPMLVPPSSIGPTTNPVVSTQDFVTAFSISISNENNRTDNSLSSNPDDHLDVVSHSNIISASHTADNNDSSDFIAVTNGNRVPIDGEEKAEDTGENDNHFSPHGLDPPSVTSFSQEEFDPSLTNLLKTTSKGFMARPQIVLLILLGMGTALQLLI